MKLWDKGYKIETAVEEFTVGNDRELDLHLAKYDALGSLAHAQMLHEVGILTDEDIKGIDKEIRVILKNIEEGNFSIDENFEDVHSKIEHELTLKLGEAGKKIHTARSRNDHVLVDMHLFCKEEIGTIKSLVKNLFDRLIALSNEHKGILIPGYTHLQIAMPSSFGMWFGAYAEALIDDIHFLNAAFKISDQNPLGSAAGYGSSFPINRTSTTQKMEFSTLKFNSVAAQMSRGKLEKSVSFALASTAGTLSKFAMDVCLYMSQNFGFLTFPAHLTTGSSIMPHKKNPDVFELIRGKCNKIQALPTELMLITNNLPSGYHRDFQLLKESLFAGLFELKSCLQICEFMLQHIIVNEDAINDRKYDYSYSVEVVNKEVQNGLSFREAYQKVGKEIEEGKYSPSKEVHHTHEGSIGNLCNDKIVEKMEKALS